jgi:ribose/xylose/arabinose/galactoside ABC-type transport system permease subunit
MDLAVEIRAGGGGLVRPIALAAGWLFEHPAIGIPVGILLICVLIALVALAVRRRRSGRSR